MIKFRLIILPLFILFFSVLCMSAQTSPSDPNPVVCDDGSVADRYVDGTVCCKGYNGETAATNIDDCCGGSVLPLGDECCGNENTGTNYDPTGATGEGCCGETIYDLSTAVCCDDGNSGPSSSNICCDEDGLGSTKLGTGDACCDDGTGKETAYDTSTHECCNDGDGNFSPVTFVNCCEDSSGNKRIVSDSNNCCDDGIAGSGEVCCDTNDDGMTEVNTGIECCDNGVAQTGQECCDDPDSGGSSVPVDVGDCCDDGPVNAGEECCENLNTGNTTSTDPDDCCGGYIETSNTTCCIDTLYDTQAGYECCGSSYGPEEYCCAGTPMQPGQYCCGQEIRQPGEKCCGDQSTALDCCETGSSPQEYNDSTHDCCDDGTIVLNGECGGPGPDNPPGDDCDLTSADCQAQGKILDAAACECVEPCDDPAGPDQGVAEIYGDVVFEYLDYDNEATTFGAAITKVTANPLETSKSGVDVIRFIEDVYFPDDEDPVITNPAILDVAPYTEVSVNAKLITVNDAPSRDLSGSLTLSLTQGASSELSIFYYDHDTSAYKPYTLGSTITVEATGHSGCGIHYWHSDNVNFRVISKSNGPFKFTATVDPDEGSAAITADVELLKVDVVPDWDRNGKIDQADLGKATDSDPFRFWVNDDDDSGDVDLGVGFGEVDGEDVPGQGNDADANDGFVGSVDGMRDLVDFFPLFFDLEDFLGNFDDTSSVDLKLSGTGMRFIEYGSDFGGFAPDEAGDYLRDVLIARELVDFDTRSISEDEANPTPLGDTFRDLTAEGRGVLLLESYEATTEPPEPLVLHVFVDDNELFKYEFHLKTSGVEEMFFLRNITDVTKEYDDYPNGDSIEPYIAGEPTRTSAPNWPDERTNGKYLVYLHGFKVNGQQARGEHAECFKRLHQMGSNTRFIGVNWHGAYNVDYHKGVFNALQTGHHLNGRLGLSGDVSVIAHSLGNMVVSNAIQNGGFRPDRYFMMNAAVAIEAYSGGSMDTDMVESEWISFNIDGSVNQSESISEDEYASNWYQLFNGTSDDRNEFFWKDYFGQVPLQTSLHNFYSPGEDVLAKIPGSNDASIIGQILDNGFDFARGAWKRQELVKGTIGTGPLSSLLIDRAQAGWSINGDYPGTGDLKLTPRFDPFLEADLTGADAQVASSKASEEKVLYDVLARGIPALSHAAAVDLVPSPPLATIENYNLEDEGRLQADWPTQGHGDVEEVGRWLHSDFRSVALPYVYPLYNKLIQLGDMDDE